MIKKGFCRSSELGGNSKVTGLKTIRHSLVRTRDSLLYGRRNRRLAETAHRLRGEGLDALAYELPQLAAADPIPRLEVHMMCGNRQATMGLWSSWSALRFFPGARLIVHSDGSLSNQSVAAWQRMAPGTRIVSREENLAAMQCRFAAFPRLRDWSRNYHFGLKIGGVYSTAEADVLLEIDSDTLTLRKPEELLKFLGNPGKRLAWNEDLKSCYACPEDVLRDNLGAAIGVLPERLNAGYMMVRKLDDTDWAFLETSLEKLSRDPRVDVLRFWMHQTLWALLASRMGSAAGPLPPTYAVHDGPTRAGAVMRHYVGTPGVRPRFFTEGLPTLIKEACMEFHPDRASDLSPP